MAFAGEKRDWPLALFRSATIASEHDAWSANFRDSAKSFAFICVGNAGNLLYGHLCTCISVLYQYIISRWSDMMWWLFFKEPGTVLAVCICPKLSCWTDLARLMDFHGIFKMFPNSQRKKMEIMLTSDMFQALCLFLGVWCKSEEVKSLKDLKETSPNAHVLKGRSLTEF